MEKQLKNTRGFLRHRPTYGFREPADFSDFSRFSCSSRLVRLLLLESLRFVVFKLRDQQKPTADFGVFKPVWQKHGPTSSGHSRLGLRYHGNRISFAVSRDKLVTEEAV